MFKRLFNIFSSKNNADKLVFSLLSTLLVLLAIFLVAGMLFPTAVAIILNIFWITLLAIVFIFFALGILVILGMRKEVSHFLDIVLEGSISLIEFLNFIKELWKKFVALVKEFLLYAAGIFSYITAFLCYMILIILYKSIGLHFDVTLFTIVITVTLLILFGILSKPKPEVETLVWREKFFRKYKSHFIDAVEVFLFVFFLTMDSTRLFFLPSELNIPLQAQVGDYDLMVRSFVLSDHLKITLNLIAITVLIEILRNVVKVFANARRIYTQHSSDQEDVHISLNLITQSIRKSFFDSKNDLMKFITYTTVLFLVFLFFPRLKLLTLLIASITNLSLDLIFRERLYSKRGSDLISRTIAKAFKL